MLTLAEKVDAVISKVEVDDGGVVITFADGSELELCPERDAELIRDEIERQALLRLHDELTSQWRLARSAHRRRCVSRTLWSDHTKKAQNWLGIAQE